MLIRFFCSLIIGACLQASMVFGNEDACLLNKSALDKPEFFSSKEFVHAKWDDRRKVASFRTRQGETLTVTYMACENLGMDADLTVGASSKDALRLEFIAGRVKWLAGLVLGEGKESGFLKNHVTETEFRSHFQNGVFDQKEMMVEIPSTTYSEAVLKIGVFKGRLTISISTVTPG